MDRSLLATLAFSAVGMAALGVVALASEPPLVAIPELGQHIGSTVRVRALVQDVRPSGPFLRLVLAAENRTVEATSEQAPAASPGDHVEAVGTVERFQGRLQLRLGSGTVKVLQPWQAGHVPLAVLLAAPWERQGMNVVTSGRPLPVGNSWRLSAAEATATIALTGIEGDPPPVLHRVEARLDYEADKARFRLDARDLRPLAA